MARGFGRLPLPRDDHDFRVRKLLVPTTKSRQFWSMGGPTLRLDQGPTGTCEGNAWTNVLIAGPTTHPDYAAFDTSESAEEWARELYVEATGDETLQDGATTRSILRTLLGRGQIGAYHRCASVDEVTGAILQIGPVGFALPWYSSLDNVVEQYGNAYIFLDESSGIRGYHEVALTGVDLAPSEGPPYARLENSWGPDWGHNGTVRVPIPDLHSLYLGDAFTVTEATF